MPPAIDLNKLKEQQTRLRHHARLHWAHWFILIMSLIITVFAWQTAENALLKRDQLRFDTEVERAIGQIRVRLGHYEDALLSAVAAMQSHNGDMTRDQWRQYSRFLDLNERYPGISGIGVIDYVDTANIPAFLDEVRISAPDFDIYPAHDQALSLPIKYIEPEDSNRSALGLDVAFETNRRTAALKARQSGSTQISGPITLVQDADKTPGFLFYAPYYDQIAMRNGALDLQANEKYFLGLIYAPLVVRDLVHGSLGQETPLVNLSIHDGNIPLFVEDSATNVHSPTFSATEAVYTHGRVWSYTINSTPLFEDSSPLDQPIIVLLSGLCLDAMLFVLFWLMSRSNRTVLALAEEMTDGLSSQAQQLSANNRDLESFAHIVSHDLKTPLRNIHSLTDILEEDLDVYLASNDPKAEIQPRINSLRDQVTRSQSLISGILEYSVQDGRESPTSMVDTRELLTLITEQLKLQPRQLSLIGSFPMIETNETRLQQVFTNLIQNAIKYNPDHDSATVEVTASQQYGVLQFAIRDNGPGIEKRYHKQIFQPFTTLESVTDIHSSGIGLSIVQRAIEHQGGHISVSSVVESVDNPEKGTTFTFTWPLQNGQLLSEQEKRHA